MKKGALLLEALLSIVILSLILGFFYPGMVGLIKKSGSLRYGGRAAVLLQEEMEVAYNVFLGNWEGWSEGTYHPAVESVGGRQIWTLLSGDQSEVETRFSRSVTIENVCRHPQTGQLKEQCGNGEKPDDLSRKVTGVVRWNDSGRDRELTASFLIAKL